MYKIHSAAEESQDFGDGTVLNQCPKVLKVFVKKRKNFTLTKSFWKKLQKLFDFWPAIMYIIKINALYAKP